MDLANAKLRADHFTQTRISARGLYVWTDDIWDQSKWSDPIYFDATGIDQDVSPPRAC